MIVMNGRMYVISIIVVYQYHNSKQVGEEEEQGGGNTPKIEQDFKTSIGMLL